MTADEIAEAAALRMDLEICRRMLFGGGLDDRPEDDAEIHEAEILACRGLAILERAYGPTIAGAVAGAVLDLFRTTVRARRRTPWAARVGES